MVRGTTPTFTFRLKDQSVDLTQATRVYVTFSDMNEKELMTKENEDLDIDVREVSVYLSQAETITLPKKAKVQLNWLYQDGSKTKRACTTKKVINVDTNLLDKELPNG